MTDAAGLERVVKDAIKLGNYPAAVQMMFAAGIRHYHADVKSHTITYCSDDAEYTERGAPPAPLSESGGDAIDSAGLDAATSSFRGGRSDYRTFLRELWRAGVAAYDVDLATRKITYQGRGGDSQVVAIQPQK